jgi:hypothetical protein
MVAYPVLNEMADDGRWEELLALASSDAPLDQRHEAAHIVALDGPTALAVAAAELFPDDDVLGYRGPLWEVVSCERPWQELEPYLSHPRVRRLTAQTRVLAGEDLCGQAEPDGGAPLCLEPWEAAHWDRDVGADVPEYLRGGGGGGSLLWRFPGHLAHPVTLAPGQVEPVRDDAVEMLGRLSGWVRVSAFRGTAWEAASPVAAGHKASVFPFEAAYPALVHLATGGSAYEPRTGQALGRLAVWAALAAMARTSDPAGITAFVGRTRCVGWQALNGRRLPLNFIHLAIEDPQRRVSWVLDGYSDD